MYRVMMYAINYTESVLHICLLYGDSGLTYSKKYIDQEPPSLMRQICVLHWEEIKTNGQRIIFEEKGPRGGIRIYCYSIFHIDQKAKNHMFSL